MKACIFAALECASFYAIASGLEKERKHIRLRKLILCLLWYLLYFAVSTCFQFPAEFSFFGYIVIFIGIKWLFGEDFLHTLAVAIISSIITAVIEFLMICIVSMIIPADDEAGVYEMIVTIGTFLIVIVITRLKIHKVLDIMEKRDFSYVVVGILSLMIFAPMLLLKTVSKLESWDYIYIVVCIVVMWFLVVKVQKYKLESKIRHEYMDAYQDVITQIRRRQHKIKNQINTAYSMFRIYDTYDELVANQKEYLARIVDYELPNDAIALEEPSVIALIYEKINEAVEREIHVETSFRCSMADSRISDMVWVDIIGTLLDNAIEALEDFDGARKIWLTICKKDKNKISVQVRNTYRKLTVTETGRFFELGYSTKGDGRGVGLYNIKRIVDKNKGEIIAASEETEAGYAIRIEIIV